MAMCAVSQRSPLGMRCLPHVLEAVRATRAPSDAGGADLSWGRDPASEGSDLAGEDAGEGGSEDDGDDDGGDEG